MGGKDWIILVLLVLLFFAGVAVLEQYKAVGSLTDTIESYRSTIDAYRELASLC